MDCKERLRDCFDEMVVYKDLKKTNFFSALSLPSFMRDWLLKKFEDENGNFDKDDMVRFVKKYIPRKDDWTSIKNRVIVEGERVKFLAKISIDIDVKTGQVSFALPDFGLGYKQGVVLSDSLSKAITEKTKLVSVMMVNNEIGTIEPIKELATIAHTHNVLFHTDAVQAVGHIPIDVNELGIDMLSSSAHKFNGPKGIGFLYIRKGTQIRPLADGGAQEFHMRAGTENIASIVGMAVALKKNCRTMQETSTKLQAMDHAFIDVLHEANVDFIRNGSVSKSPGIISVSIRNISGEMLLHRLDLKGISISTGSACDSVNTQVSHVIKAIGVPSAYAQGTIRISFGHDNQIEDAVEIAHAIAKILQT